MIKPEPGRVVHYYMTEGAVMPDGFRKPEANRPCAAQIAYVFNDRMVNLSVIDQSGKPFPITSVKLLQDNDLPEGHSAWAEWMPFQKGQAANADTKNVKPVGNSYAPGT